MAGRRRAQALTGAALILGALSGCGNSYRQVVTPITPTGPASQPSGTVVVLSSTSSTANGIITLVNYSGDSITVQATVGLNPTALSVNDTGATGTTLNSDKTLSSFTISSSLQTRDVQSSTLLSGSTPGNMLTTSSNQYLVDTANDQVDILTGTPAAVSQSVNVGKGVIGLVGNSGAQRLYSFSQGVSQGTCATPSSVTTTGTASSIEVATNTVSATLPVGICPVYGVMSSDDKRAFILNRGSGTVTVLNAQLNSFLQTLPVGAGPVHADLNATTSQLVVVNYEAGTVSVIDVSLDLYGNNASTFGTTHTIKVGNHPIAVTILADGSRAYVANQDDSTVSIINLNTFTVVGTLSVTGHPRVIGSISNSIYGKVYTVSPDSSTADATYTGSPYMTVIDTQTDTVSTSIRLQGTVVDMRVTSQSAGSTNNVITSRLPGSGQP